MTKSDLYSKTRAAVLIAAAVLALLFTACPNNAGGGGDSTVNITVKKVQGEGKVGTIPSDPVSVPLGSSWSSVKEILRSKIVFTPGFTLNSGHPGDDANTQEFADGYIFYEDATIFIKSRKDLPDISTIQGPGTQIKITLAVDPERGQILGPEVISVNSGTTWAQLEAYAKAALKANYGFKEEGAEWKNGSTVLGSTDSFGTDATLTAYPEDIRIRIKVTGDNNKVMIDKPDEPIIAIPGSKWKEIKAKADDKVRVKDKTRYAITAWHKGTDASGSKLTDGYEFQESDRPDCTVFAETGDRQITLTVKYGTGSGTPSSGGTITINDGDTWASVKAQAEGKVIVPQDHIIREWRLNGTGGPVINDSYTFKASDGNAQTVYAKLEDLRIIITVKYGNISTVGSEALTAGSITVHDGDVWTKKKIGNKGKKVEIIPKVKKTAEDVIPPSALAHAVISEWRWDDANGEPISNGYTFKLSDGRERTVFAIIRPEITMSVTQNVQTQVKYYAWIDGSVTEGTYVLANIPAASGTIGKTGKSDNAERSVSLNAYSMGATEVPQALYRLVMGYNLSQFSWDPSSGEIQELRPVENVSWYYAAAFCNELTRCTKGLGMSECVYTVDDNPYTIQDAKKKKIPQMNMSKKGFRLPTEAEWEWAAQGGSARQVYAGTGNRSDLKDYAWYKANSYDKTHTASEKANPLRLFDMSGNVAEWCWDWYSGSTPTGGDNPTGASSGTDRAVRGGSYKSEATESKHECECAHRDKSGPPYVKDYIGFRIVCRP